MIIPGVWSVDTQPVCSMASPWLWGWDGMGGGGGGEFTACMSNVTAHAKMSCLWRISLRATSHNYTALTNFLKLSFHQETIAKTLFFQMVAVYM